MLTNVHAPLSGALEDIFKKKPECGDSEIFRNGQKNVLQCSGTAAGCIPECKVSERVCIDSGTSLGMRDTRTLDRWTETAEGMVGE